MPGTPISLADVIDAAIDARFDDVFIARAGRVTVYDDVTNTVCVKPQVKRSVWVDGERKFVDVPDLLFVPLIFPRTESYAVTLPIQAGDTVLLVFCDVSHGEWRDSGGESEPTDARRLSIGWPVAIPGFFPDTKPLSQTPADVAARAAGMVIGQHGGGARVEISPTTIKLGKDATDYVALASKVDNFISTFVSTLSNTAPVANDGGAALRTALLNALNNFPSVAATMTKAK